MEIDKYLIRELNRIAAIARVNAVYLRQPRIIKTIYNGVELRCLARTRVVTKSSKHVELYKDVLYGVETLGPYGYERLIHDLKNETWRK